jgi:beta-galactosidase
VLGSLVDELIVELCLKKGPDVPPGVMARQIDTSHFLYLNVSGHAKQITIKGKARSILFERNYNGNFTIQPYEPDFIEMK